MACCQKSGVCCQAEQKTRTYKFVVIGFGNVGQGFAQILQDQGAELASQHGIKMVIVSVCDLMKGSVYRAEGFTPAELLDTVKAGKSLETLSVTAKGWNALQSITDSKADVLVELSFTDLKTGEPAVSHVRTALSHGMHAITTNKGPVALHYPEMAALAAKHGVQFGIEGSVMSGTPCLRMGTEMLAAAGITKVKGIVNGTTNYILSQMESGAPYADALAEAQAKGYAEADPTGDVEGHDAAAKVVILANVLMGAKINLSQVDREGITKLTPKHIADAQADKMRWKLIACVEKTATGVAASVKPTLVPITHPLASVSGATNAITFSTNLLGDVTLIGAGAGRLPTGYAVLEDLLAIHRTTRK